MVHSPHNLTHSRAQKDMMWWEEPSAADECVWLILPGPWRQQAASTSRGLERAKQKNRFQSTVRMKRSHWDW